MHTYEYARSMLKKIILGFCIMALVVAGTLFTMKLGRAGHEKQQADAELINTQQEPGFVTLEACEAFQLAQAKELLGDDAVIARPSAEVSFPGQPFITSYCQYESADGGQTIKVRIRSVRNADELEAAQLTFQLLMKSSTTPITAYGDYAYWEASPGRINILKGTQWIAVSMGPTVEKDTSIEGAKKVADIIWQRL